MEVINALYFDSYGNAEGLETHRIMLNDEPRVKAYKNGLSREIIEGKVVLDVGAGTGLLSVMAAQGGAKKVYAVEASENMIPILKDMIEENNCELIIEVIEGEIEKIDLPEKVDIIVSEWMGFYLLHEGMLDSVLHAKRFLKPNGKFIPHKGEIFCSLYKEDFIKEIMGVDISPLVEKLMQPCSQPDIRYLNKNELLCEKLSVFSFSMDSLKVENLISFSKVLNFKTTEPITAHGICIWFDVYLNNILLSTSPSSPETHWKQTLIQFGEIVIKSEIKILLIFTKDGRKYRIDLNILDVN